MSQTKLAEVYYRAARILLPEMDDEMRSKIEALLQQADRGKKTDNLIVDIITQDDALRQKLREVLGSNIEKSLGGYSPLSGDPSPIPATKYVCPVQGHHYSRRLSKAGEDPGKCPEHNVPLILASKNKRGR